MVSPIGNDGLTKLVWVYTLGQGQNAETEWFTDPGFNGDSVTGMKEAASSPDGDKLAFVVDYMSQGGQATERLVLYTTNGPPPAPPTQRCAFSAPPGGGFTFPSFSPDGNLLAYADGAGIEVATVGNLSDCASVSAHVAPAGGDHPGWGPAPLMPIPGATSTCKGEQGTALRRCSARVRYLAAPRLRTARNRRTCRSNAAAAYRRALRKTR